MYLPFHEVTSTPWLVVAIILLVAAVGMMYISKLPSYVAAYAAMWGFRLSGYTPFTNNTMIFWGVAVALVIANQYMLPRHIRNTGVGMGYIATGAIAGMAVALTTYASSAVICGAIIGAIVGAIAFARTSKGAVLEFPTVKFFNYLGAKGIPAVITASMAGLILTGLLAAAKLTGM